MCLYVGGGVGWGGGVTVITPLFKQKKAEVVMLIGRKRLFQEAPLSGLDNAAPSYMFFYIKKLKTLLKSLNIFYS